MKEFNIIIMVIIFLVQPSCKREVLFSNSLERIIVDLTREEYISGEFLIIRGDSCGSCVEDAEKYAMRSLSDEDNTMKFIFTGYMSKKEIKIKLKKELNDNRIFYDSNNLFFKIQNEILYPLYCQLESGKIKKIYDLDPTNPQYKLFETLNQNN